MPDRSTTTENAIRGIVKWQRTTKQISYESVVAIAISKSSIYEEMMEEAQEWKNLMKLVAGSGKGLSGIIESTKKVILASLYIRKSPTFLNKRKVCPNMFQWQKYRKAMSV